MNDDVDGFFTNPIPNERHSRWLSWLQREVFGGAFRYRFGIGFVLIVDVLIIFVSSKIALPLETSLEWGASSEKLGFRRPHCKFSEKTYNEV